MTIHRHLRRLAEVWLDQPIYFLTVCTLNRRRELASAPIHELCREVWRNCEQRYAWLVGRYVIMPDHVHFFCSPRDESNSLGIFIGKWKEWTSKNAKDRCAIATPLWQQGFFDRLLRSDENYAAKWEYVVQNPVRAGLVDKSENWPFQGEMNRLVRE